MMRVESGREKKRGNGAIKVWQFEGEGRNVRKIKEGGRSQKDESRALSKITMKSD